MDSRTLDKAIKLHDKECGCGTRYEDDLAPWIKQVPQFQNSNPSIIHKLQDFVAHNFSGKHK